MKIRPPVFPYCWKQRRITTASEVRARVSNYIPWFNYRETSNTRRTLVGNKIVDNSDVAGASPVGAAPTTSSFST